MNLNNNAVRYFQLKSDQLVKSSKIKSLHRYSNGLETKINLLKRLSNKKRK